MSRLTLVQAVYGIGWGLLGGTIWYYTITKPNADKMKEYYSKEK